jgi:hypothetical protein
MRKLLLLSACLVTCAALAFADDKDKKDEKKEDKTKSEPTAVATEIAVNRKLDPKLFMYASGNDQTRVTFMLRYPGKQFLGVDATSKLATMKDDKDNSLLDPKSFFQTNFSTFPQIAMDRSAMLVSINAYGKAPGKGATKVLIKGDLVVVCGIDEKTEEVKKFEFKDKGEAKAGDFKVTVNREKGAFGAEGPEFTLTSKIRGVKSVVIKDADDKVAELFPRGSFGGGDNWSFSYALKKPLKEGKVLITYFSKEEKVKVPIDLSVGIGLGE